MAKVAAYSGAGKDKCELFAGRVYIAEPEKRLPPYSSGLNPVEKLWVWIKSLRKIWRMDDVGALFLWFSIIMITSLCMVAWLVAFISLLLVRPLVVKLAWWPLEP